jgi:acyl-CoA synthetase (AMP-forming)/AMP-acid ligase II
VTLHSYLLDVAQARRHDVAAIGGRYTHTYRELDQRSNGVAQRLLEQGVMPGDRVVGFRASTSASIVVNQAILRTGATCVLIDKSLSATAIRDVILDCRPTVIVSAALPSAVVLDAVRLVGATVLPAVDSWDGAGSERVDVRSHPGDRAYLVYYHESSGSIGQSAFTHGLLGAAVDAIARRVDRVDEAASAADRSALCFDIAVALTGDLRAIRRVGVQPHQGLGLRAVDGYRDKPMERNDRRQSKSDQVWRLA